HLWVNRGVTRGDPELSEVSRSAGIGGLFPRGTRAEPIKCAHVALIDMDNDGRRDIVLSVLYRDDRGRVQPVVLRNLTERKGNLKFGKPPFEKMVGYSAPAPATDFDGDGRVDLFFASWFEHLQNRLFRNVSDSGNWLRVRVEGSKANLNSMGVGAVVRVYAAEHFGEPEYLLGRHDIAIGTGYASGDEAVAHFGLGPNAQCDVEVRWGKLRRCRVQVAVNQTVTVQFE
ncbi:MAG: CRTAC1 family protein, partial [Planctomycetes bacterium]|nr:CRTAC1 family protein [Planctomycetota bacterium]